MRQSVMADVKVECCRINVVSKSTKVPGSSMFGYLLEIISPRILSWILKKD